VQKKSHNIKRDNKSSGNVAKLIYLGMSVMNQNSIHKEINIKFREHLLPFRLECLVPSPVKKFGD
jgi:hypothetical protein